MGYVCVQCGKIETIKCLAPLFLSFCMTSIALSIIQKQLTPVFLDIPLQNVL